MKRAAARSPLFSNSRSSQEFTLPMPGNQSYDNAIQEFKQYGLPD